MPLTPVGEVELYYEQHGSGEPLLLIMGTGADHTRWSPQLDAFAREFRCIVFDNRGTGRSSKPDHGYSTRTMADDAVGLLTAIGVDSAHIAGYSLGAAIAQQVAINYPRRVRSLSLYATWDRCYARFRRRFELQAEIAKLGRPELMVAYKALTLVSPDLLDRHEDEYREYERVSAARASQQASTALHALLGHYQADLEHDTSQRLSEIQAPTLIVVGADDPLTPPRYARAVRDKIPNAELVELDGADHLMNEMKAEQFNEVALRFLRSQQSGANSNEWGVGT